MSYLTNQLFILIWVLKYFEQIPFRVAKFNCDISCTFFELGTSLLKIL